jgi:tetratricopeptide (TPR) repeat protein
MRVNSRWLAALLLMAVFPLCSCSFINKLQSRDNLNKGVKEFTNQNYADAAEFFQKSIELDPEFPDDIPRVYLATTYMLQYIPGSMDIKSEQAASKAIETFSEVVERSEKKGTPNVNAMLAIASLSYQRKQIEQTKEWCNRVLDLPATTDEEKKNKAEAHYRIAVLDYDTVNEKTGLTGENVEYLEDEEKAKLQEDINEGLDHLDKAIDIRPDYFDAMMYQNLLWREKAKLEQDEDAKAELIHQADIVYNKSIQLQLKYEAEKASEYNRLELGK